MIRLEHISKQFNNTVVLRDVSLDIPEGETLAVIGRSGSGKSVLMKHAVGLLKPDEGRVFVDDANINEVPYKELRRIRRKFGVLFQGGALFDSMSSFENIAFPLRTFTTHPDKAIRSRVEECLEMVQMPNIGKKMPSELSGGMRKRVALARAIALEPKYIIYDEPTSGLDPSTSSHINELILALNERLRVTSIVITHDMHSVLAIADRIAFIHETRIAWTGTVHDLHRTDHASLLDFVRASEYVIGEPTAAPEVSLHP